MVGSPPSPAAGYQPPPPVGYQAPPPVGYQPPPPAYAPPPYYPRGPMAPMAPASQIRTNTNPGWASGAGTYGIIAGAVLLGLTVASEATKDKTIPSAPLGGVAAALFGVSVPVIAGGGSSARENPAVAGLPGLRISGWIGYAVTLADAAYLLSQAGKKEPPDGQILSVGMLGAASMACFVADAFVSASEADRIMQFERGTSAQGPSRHGVIAPFVARDPANPQRLATGLAWASSF